MTEKEILVKSAVKYGMDKEKAEGFTIEILKIYVEGEEAKAKAETLEGSNTELMDKLSKADKNSSGDRIVEYKGKDYLCTVPRFTHEKKLITFEALKEDEKLIKELVTGGFGVLVEYESVKPSK